MKAGAEGSRKGAGRLRARDGGASFRHLPLSLAPTPRSRSSARRPGCRRLSLGELVGWSQRWYTRTTLRSKLPLKLNALVAESAGPFLGTKPTKHVGASRTYGVTGVLPLRQVHGRGTHVIIIMSRPWRNPATGVLYYRSRLPADLKDAVVGEKVTVDVAGEPSTVKLVPIFKVSLRTKDATEARLRHASVQAQLEQRWASTSGPMVPRATRQRPGPAGGRARRSV